MMKLTSQETVAPQEGQAKWLRLYVDYGSVYPFMRMRRVFSIQTYLYISNDYGFAVLLTLCLYPVYVDFVAVLCCLVDYLCGYNLFICVLRRVVCKTIFCMNKHCACFMRYHSTN